MSIKCGNKKLAEHTHDTVAEVRECFVAGVPLRLVRPAPNSAAATPRPETAVDNAPCGCNGYHGDGAHCYTCGRLRVTTSAYNTDVPAGRYAIMIAEKLRFFQVDKGKGRWAGYTFMSELFGAPGDFTKDAIRNKELRADYLGRIEAAGLAESAALFGHKLGCCGRCLSPLTDVRSRAAGYGETCAGHMGWPYPSEHEARVQLREYLVTTDGMPVFSGVSNSADHVS